MNSSRLIAPSRGHVLAVLVTALVAAGLATELAIAADYGNWKPVCDFVYFGVIGLFPLLLARLAPAAAGFDTQWLPSSRRHWIWFFGMLVLWFVVKVVVAALGVIVVGSPPEPSGTLSAPIGHILEAIAVLLVAPVAEEIFFRGYLLEQLRKLVRPSIALLAQAFLFGLVHLYVWGFSLFSFVNSLNAILFGLIAGLWRIRFKSLLPIVLAHILGNSPGISFFVEEYDRAVSLATAPDAAGTVQSDVTALDKLMESAKEHFDRKEYALALSDLRKASEIDPRYFVADYDLGWIYATSPDPTLRNGQKALFHATRAATVWFEDAADDNRAQWMPWACLAAAYAEKGDFDNAIENQKKAIEYLRFVPEDVRPIIEPRVKVCLELYKARKPLRSRAISLGKVGDAWLNAMLNPGREGFPEIAE